MTDKKSESEIDKLNHSETPYELSRQQYESLIQSIDGIVWEAEADTFKFIFVNKQAEKILGYPVEQWLTEPDFWINHLHPGDREWVVGFCINATQRKENHQFEYRMIAADGHVVWLRDIVTVSVAADQSVRLRGVMVDVTERIEAMNELRAGESRMRLLLEQLPAVIWSTDLDLRYTHMAGRGLALLQVPEERYFGLSLYEYFQTDDANFKPIAAHLRALSGESISYEMDWMGYIFDAYVEPLRNAVGEIVGCVGIGMDVTRRKRAEENVLKEKHLTEAIFESLPGIVYLFNQEGKCLRWNENFERALGLSASEVARRHLLDNIVPEKKSLAAQRVEEVFTTGQSTLEADLVSKDGNRTPYFFTGRHVTIGQQPCLVGMGIDITERKRAEEENDKLIRVLGERVKELTLLHHTASILQDERKSVPELLQEIVTLTPLAWQYPEVAAARITFGEMTFETESFAQTRWSQSAELKAAGIRGTLEIVYLEERPTVDEGPFMKEERNLINSLAEIICSALNRLYAQRELRESQRRFQDTLTNLEMIAVMADTNGNVMFCNDCLLRLTGWRREEAIGQNWFEMFLPNHEKGRVKKILDEATSENPVIPHFENEIKTRSGERRLVKWTNTTLHDLGGRVIGVAALGNDITERKRIEKQLRKSEERYRELVENAIDIIYTHDLKGNYTSINKAGEKITGYTREEALTMNLVQIVAPESLERSRQMITDKLAGAGETIYDLDILAKDGRRIAIEVNTRLVLQDGVPFGIQGIARDVTERKSLEAQLHQSQKLEAVGHLAGGIAHDFNNMLTAINGYSALILRQLDKYDPLHSKVSEIKKAGERAASLTHQLLAFSRKQVLKPKIIDLNSIVSDLEKMLRRLIRENINLRTVLKPELGTVKADPGQVEQVLINLVVNAGDAMPQGGKLTIETANVYLNEEYAAQHFPTKPGSYVMVSVSDTGVGIDATTRQHIFEPFFTTKELGKGTGLGLATVYGIVKQSGGYIWVDSEVGQGTSFKIYLPRVDELAQEYKPNREHERIPHGTETVLLAEDDEIVRNLVREILENSGYQVLEAANGEAALLICKAGENPIHLLITDAVMPEISGQELVARVFQLRPEIKVLYISGYMDEVITHPESLGGDTPFLEKPFTPDSLARKVREILDKT